MFRCEFIILGQKIAQTKGQLAREQFGIVGVSQETGGLQRQISMLSCEMMGEKMCLYTIISSETSEVKRGMDLTLKDL